MFKILVLSGLLVLVSCNNKNSGMTSPDPITFFKVGMCCASQPLDGGDQHLDYIRNGALELNAVFINAPNAPQDVTTQATWSVDDSTMARLDAGTIACTKMPSRRCKVMRTLDKIGATKINASWNGQFGYFQLAVWR